MEKDSVENLIKIEKFYRLKGNQKESLETIIEILKKIKTSSSKYQQEILSKVLIHKNQTIFVILGVYQYIIKNKLLSLSIIEKKDSYNILYSSLSKVKDNNSQYKSSKDEILKIFHSFKEKEKDNNFFNEIEKIIMSISNLYESSINRTNAISLVSNNDPKNNNNSEAKNNYLPLSDHSFLNSNASINLTTSYNLSKLNTIRKDSSNNQLNYKLKFVDNKKVQNDENPELKKYKPNNNLPYILFNFTATLSNGQILTLITQIFEKIKFKKVCTIKENNNESISVYEKVSNKFWKKCCGCCFSQNSSQFHINIILENSNLLNDKYERRIFLRSIKGSEKKLKKKIIKFLYFLSSSLIKFKILKISKQLIELNLEELVYSLMNNNKNKLLNQSSAVDDKKPNKIMFNFSYISQNDDNNNNSLRDSIVEESNKEANKLYEIYKVLSKSDYDLGKSVSFFISNFKNQYNDFIQNVAQIDLRDLMLKIIEEIDDCVTTFNTSFNNNCSNIKSNIYIRQASEQFIFNKIYFMLIEIYKLKYKNENEKFIFEKNKINKKLSIDEIFNYLDIKKKFRGTENIPFKISIDLIDKIQFEQSPKKKFENLMKSNLEMRNNILEFTKGKNELDSMDDELPLTIYLTTQIKMNYLVPEIHMVDDYLKCTVKDDILQNKMVTNLLSSISYISNSWENI